MAPAKKRTPKDAADPNSPFHCGVKGCGLKGEYRAPRSKESLREFIWLCLDHVRDYNRTWDYFSGMGQKEIENFMQDATTGHRPTWKMGDQPFVRPDLLQEKIAEFLNSGKRPRKPRAPEITPKEQRALDLFELEPPIAFVDIKKRYKILVKRYHPDVNKGSKKAEETFKKITEAYQILQKRFTEK